MSEIIKLKKGLNIKLKGRPGNEVESLPVPSAVALKPADFHGLSPKLNVKIDQEVKAGDVLFYDKYHPEVKFTAPMGGKVVNINRGERRRILEVVVATDPGSGYVEFQKADPESLSRDEIRDLLLKSGLWPFIKKRPYGITALPDERPKAIFISTFDTAPLAPDYNLILKDQLGTFQTAVNAVKKLTDGKVYLGVSGNTIFGGIKNAEIRQFSGPHPSGNVGIQIHHVTPVSKGEVVWTVNVQDMLFIGRLFETGRTDFSKVVALTGSEVKNPKYYKTILGAPVSLLTDGKLVTSDYKQRMISGNVLTGTRVKQPDYTGFYDNQFTVIPEGDEYELLGWGTPGIDKFSASKTFFASLFPKKEYNLNANLHGGERAFVMSGQYENLVPMDILPVYLLKAILVNDIDKMEQLGIYEVVEEDFALCEYACTSKIKVQEILRSGIEIMIKELG